MSLMVLLLYFKTDVLPLFIGIKVQLMLIPIIGQLVVHAVRNSGTEQRLMILESLTGPDNEDIIFTDSLPIVLSAFSLK